MDPAVFLMDENASETLFLITDNFPPVAVSIALKAPTTTPFSAFQGRQRQRRQGAKCTRKDIFQSVKGLRPVTREDAANKLNDALEDLFRARKDICDRLFPTFEYRRKERKSNREFVCEFLNCGRSLFFQVVKYADDPVAQL